jgi:hypothetical protein
MLGTYVEPVLCKKNQKIRLIAMFLQTIIEVLAWLLFAFYQLHFLGPSFVLLLAISYSSECLHRLAVHGPLSLAHVYNSNDV